MRDCLARIAARDDVVKAWVNFDPDLALAQARALDRGPRRGPLHGVPIGVKDIIDTFDMPTEMGSPIYRGHRPPADAACVALLRRAGAVILGKTVTCEFAGMAPAATTNPHNAAHTPGGSSSGSAAAVADHMVPAALGTQTGGSVLRPSSFCGIFGYKPTYNTFNKAGVKPAAESIDTIGWLARSIDDIELLTAVLAHAGAAAAAPVWAPRRASGSAAPKFGIRRSPKPRPRSKTPPTNSARPARRCATSTLPEAFTGLHAIARGTINFYERAACMAFEWDHHREALSPQMRRYIENGQKTSRDDYVAGLAARRRMSRAVAGSVRRIRRAAGAVRAGRGAERSRLDRRPEHAGDVDGAAHAHHDAADPSRSQQFAGRHSTGRATLR